MDDQLTYRDKNLAWARLPLIVLVSLSMLLSCTAKQSVQVLLNAPITKPLNPNKTTVSQQHEACPSVVKEQEQYTLHQTADVKLQVLQLILTDNNNALAVATTAKAHRANAPPSYYTLKPTPLYILYSNLKLLS